MILNIADHKLTVIERGVYYFGLSSYPCITDSELGRILAFIKYEKSHGRKTEVLCGDEDVLAVINNAVSHIDTTANVLPVAENDFVYHATDIVAAQKILHMGKLLSAEKVYGKTAAELACEKSRSPWNDPADYFEYIMFCWGDDPTGDYVVLSESAASEDDLANGNFNAGVRFYFRYEDITRHPGCTFDGYHPVKVKNEIVLTGYLYACIVPAQYMNGFENSIPPELAVKIYHLSQNKLGISDWNKEVYGFVSKL